jgi:bla regulator protein BlaR1
MKLSLIDILLSNGTARAVCWTLVHSLWEGLLVALMAGLIILTTRRRSAAMRYNLLAADLLLFMLIAGATFVYETCQDAQFPAPGTAQTTIEMTANGDLMGDHSGGHGVLTGTHTGPNVATGDNAIPPTANLLLQASDYLNTHAILVTLIWLACLSVQMLRLTLGLYQVRRLRRSYTLPPQPFWNERLSALARRLGIKRTVTLLQSALVKAPSALGFLKPSILVPIGMLANLPPDQVETILLHELAHIRRGDYAANLLLHLTEAIFFFNPGIRWVATLIRQEREACCDDIVLAGVPDRNSYFEALVAFKQWVIDGSFADGRSFTLQLGGGKTDLLWRIRRMLERENKKLQIMEKAILSFGLMALVTISLISMKQKDNGQPSGQITAQSATQITAQSAVQPTALNAANNLATLAGHDTHPNDIHPNDTIPNERTTPTPGQTRTFPSFTIHTDANGGRPIQTSSAKDDQGNHYELRMVDGNITEFKVNGQRVAKENYRKYTDFFVAEEQRLKAPLGLGLTLQQQSTLGLQQSTLEQQQSTLRSLEQQQSTLRSQGQQQSMQEAQRLERSLQEMNRSMAQLPTTPGAPETGKGYSGTTQYDEAVRRYEEAASRYDEATRRYELAQRVYEEKVREREVSPAEPLSPVSPMDPFDRVSPVTPIAPEARLTLPVRPVRPDRPEPPPTLANPIIWNNPNPHLKKLVAELIESKLIDRVDKFSLSLDANGMTINDVRQPDEVFAKFKAKYIRHANEHIIYSQYYRSDSSGSHCDVNIDDTVPDQKTDSK